MSVSLTSVPRKRLGHVPFTVGLAGLLVAGMVGLLALNIAIQSGSAQLRAAQNQAKALSDEAAAMQAEVYRIGSVMNLAQQAAALGMRPNPYGAFINLADGSVTGTQQRVSGAEVPGMLPTATGTATSPVQIKIYPWGDPTTSPVPSATVTVQPADGTVTLPVGEPTVVPSGAPTATPTVTPTEPASTVTPTEPAPTATPSATPTAVSTNG